MQIHVEGQRLRVARFQGGCRGNHAQACQWSNEQLDKADVILDDYMKNLGEPITRELFYKTILLVEEKPIITSGGPVSKATGFLDDYMREKNEG